MEIFGYVFKHDELLETALTTPSYRMDYPSAMDNQRLEFLGDAVLGFLSAERLYTEFPNEPEGKLTIRRAHSVSSAALCEVAMRANLAARLKRNRGAAELPRDSKILADAVEAILGATYLDGGLDAARQVFAALELNLKAEESGEWSGNPKGELQSIAQAMKPVRRPVYELIEISGKSHEPVFTVRVTVEGVGSAVASHRTHKGAEALSAKKLMETFALGHVAK